MITRVLEEWCFNVCVYKRCVDWFEAKHTCYSQYTMPRNVFFSHLGRMPFLTYAGAVYSIQTLKA
jgi:hypothetical protein